VAQRDQDKRAISHADFLSTGVGELGGYLPSLFKKGLTMKRTPLSIPEVALIAGTRAALGAGVALLLGDRLTREQRQAVGWTLLGVGVTTTVPILLQLLKAQPDAADGANGAESAGASRARERIAR
jgi:hypothetical protein